MPLQTETVLADDKIDLENGIHGDSPGPGQDGRVFKITDPCKQPICFFLIDDPIDLGEIPLTSVLVCLIFF